MAESTERKFVIRDDDLNRARIFVDGQAVPHVYGYALEHRVGTCANLRLDLRVPHRATVKGRGAVEFEFDLPEREDIRYALFRQLKEEFEGSEYPDSERMARGID